MKTWLSAVGLAVGALLLTRTSLGLRIGHRIRALSDELMLGFLRLTSEFEREAQRPPADLSS